ncbi:DUF4129 domain-containing transglutaminase family protein [Enterococcus sp. AZ192]|uniref:DUF4129 domain-containing transglutaminase family protein n=1 Tax=unclassified Enterococcus TaxID=2608891 RepID=UPI003D2D4534
MQSRIKEKWLFALLSFLMLTTTALPFLKVYHLNQAQTPFLISMIAVICMITLIIKKLLIKIPLYFIFYFFTLYRYFPLDELFGFKWLLHFFERFDQTYLKMLSGEFNYLPDIVALVLILFLLVLLAILLIHYERWALSYLLLTGYLLMLAAFNRLNLGIHVIITTSAAVLFYSTKQSFKDRSKKRTPFILLSSLLLGLTAISAYTFPIIFPKSKTILFTQTTDIRTFLNRQGVYQKIEQYGLNAASTTGFSDDDTQLGGPMSDDRTILFTAEQSTKHYWRVETKNNYTGKGWNNLAQTTPSPSGQPLIISSNPEYQGTFNKPETITLSFDTAKDYLPYPYGKSSIAFEEIGQTEQIEQKNRFVLSEQPASIHLTWEEIDFSVEHLQQAAFSDTLDLQTTQLPVRLPERIKTLALSLTEDQETLYGKVKAIEDYLKTNGGYRYSKVDASYTPEDKDYVDTFLFESKVGYCDNFSSAMTILLRSIDIPSRWAKGFSAGELTTNTAGKKAVYTIRNSDAHSWPEVYFEGYGWVPFEPTPGFTNNVRSTTLTENSTLPVESSSVEKDATPLSSNEENRATENSATTATAVEKNKNNAGISPSLLKKSLVGLVLIILFITGYFLRKYFFVLSFRIYLAVYPKQFTSAYLKLLKKAEQLVPRSENEALIHFAERLENNYPQCHGSFYRLTELYEKELYGGREAIKSDYTSLLLHTANLLASFKKR